MPGKNAASCYNNSCAGHYLPSHLPGSPMPRRTRREPPPSPEPEPGSAGRTAYEESLEALAAENQAHKQNLARRFEPVLNAYLQTQAPGNAEQKKALARRVSADLKRLGLSIHHPDTDQ